MNMIPMMDNKVGMMNQLMAIIQAFSNEGK